ncbi:glycosyltransferase family 4 protein [Alkalinema sp. FACHB-956]|uniref:glycosyltransferase family 4 protein n=1 Tax=Alkalinema sp. FACHB-956 TaxID=2692768 RepID=UPI001688063A|nr:glycosyltransferase family 4 protein [Alkalinema sp. FACHB-956]MBD2329065.1 glycosyltransferase family 4 protein [Alkalinema sp. FACHB-956]
MQAPIEFTGIVSAIAEQDALRENIRPSIPDRFKGIYYRLRIDQKVTEKNFLKQLKNYDAAYIWPAISVNTFLRARKQNKPIFLERVNCFQGFSKEILDDAYQRLGLIPQHGITDEMVQDEIRKVELSDLLFCPGAFVKDSFLKAGFPAEKLVATSYGWCPDRFAQLLKQSPYQPVVNRPFTVLFVGSICVRKGVHLLMEAFLKSGIEGRLLLCGKIEPAIAEACRDLLNHPKITCLPFSYNVTEVFQQADVFAFPTLEEGDPQVTYEAMAHGLPVLVSPMGAGVGVRNGIDGWVLPPYEQDAWIEALRTLAANLNQGYQMGQAGWKNSQQFTYDKVAERRAHTMWKILSEMS